MFITVHRWLFYCSFCGKIMCAGEITPDTHNFSCETAAMKIAIASDHAGYRYKEEIRRFLTELGHDVADFGTDSKAPVDYPQFIRPAAEAVARGQVERAVVLGGSGNGEAIVANRIHGVRCALCWNEESALLARRHNDANAISLGQRLIELDTALRIIELWLTTEFEGGRHAQRIAMIDE
jgi:ribose 5-phosphate isomerase B